MKYINAHETKIEISHFFLCEKEEGESVTLEEIEQVIDRMESADVAEVKHGEWVSCDERLPEEKGEYLVSYHPCYWDNVDKEVMVGMDTFRGKTKWAKEKYQRVIAWMPLPEPYEAKEKQNDNVL